MFVRRRRSKDEGGASAVEFGLLVMPFAILLFGMIQLGFYFYSAQSTASAARETARRVVVGDCWNGTARDEFARDQAPLMTGGADLNQDPATLEVGDPITVTLTATSDVIGFIPFIPGEVIRSYDARMEEIEDSGACE
jgi:Flp pilus assembly protein TadG